MGGSNIEKRVRRVEDALIASGVLGADLVEGADVTGADWEWLLAGVNPVWEVSFLYRCQGCHKPHRGGIEVSSRVADGMEYTVHGPCGAASRMKIWKNLDNKTKAELAVEAGQVRVTNTVTSAKV